MTTKFMTVRGREWSIEVPVLLHADGTLEFAAGNRRPYDAATDCLREAKAWQVREFHAMRKCICSEGFGMNLSCPIHGVAVPVA